MDDTIASAVVLPEELLPPASPSNKRRQPSIPEESAKRPRLDETIPNGRRDSNGEVKSAAPVRRERGRERRLFGAVLGALSQAPSITAAQKRRSEIEKRQLAQRRQEDEESEQRKTERIARRKIQRWTEQKRFEEQSVRAVIAACCTPTLTSARCDSGTKTYRLRLSSSGLSLCHTWYVPNVEEVRCTIANLCQYYKPWETSPEEEKRIQDQIAEARKLIDQELEEYEARQKEEANRERRASRDYAEANRTAQDSHTGKKHDAEAPPENATPNGNADGSHNSPKDQDMKDDPAEDPGHEAVRVEATEHALDSTVAGHEATADDPSKDNDDDENGEDVVEEAAEDTVIY
jgi:hypothetical protein